MKARSIVSAILAFLFCLINCGILGTFAALAIHFDMLAYAVPAIACMLLVLAGTVMYIKDDCFYS